MKVIRTSIPEVLIFEPPVYHDDRGFLFESFNRKITESIGASFAFLQDNQSSSKANVLRGLHYQAAPHQEAKIVRCIRGALFDVIVDLRFGSPSYCRWTAVELTSENRRALYVPKDMAHGFQTLADDTDVYYEMSAPYVAGAGRGVRWNDPRFAIEWPTEPVVLSDKDANWRLFDRVYHLGG